MTRTYDLDSIEPARRGEVARRISILDRYVAIALPDADDDAAHAAEVGVGVAQFLRLARVWRRHRRPELLPGALPRSIDVRPRPDPASGVEAAGDALVLDAVALDLPVRLEAPRSLPLALLAFDPFGGRIHCWRLGSRRLDASGAALLLLNLPSGGIPLREASAHMDRSITADDLGRELHRAGVAFRTTTPGALIGAVARRTLGNRIGRIALRSRSVRRADALDAPGPSATLSLTEAAEAFRCAVRDHNANRAAGHPSLANDDRGRRLTTALTSMTRQAGGRA